MREGWLAEWKWDGIRGQIVRRDGQSMRAVVERRGGGNRALSGGCLIRRRCFRTARSLDGEVLAGTRPSRVLPFSSPAATHRPAKGFRLRCCKAIPVRFVAYDLLGIRKASIGGRGRFSERRGQLERVVAAAGSPALQLSPVIPGETWAALDAARGEARVRGVEGIMLKKWDASYGAGRQRGAWWKWKIEPYVFDGVLLYAAPGHGRRSNLYTDYTFGVWNQSELVPIAKAYSGLTDEEIRRLDGWIRKNTKEKFGIVRSVEPDACIRTRLRRNRPITAAQIRHRAALPADRPLANRQTGERGQLAGRSASSAHRATKMSVDSGERLRMARAWFTSRGRTAFEFQEARLVGILGRPIGPAECGDRNRQDHGARGWGRLIEGAGGSGQTRHPRVVDHAPCELLPGTLEGALSEPLHFFGSNWRVEQRTGDTSSARRARQKRRRPPQALITTPESLSLLLTYADMALALSNVDAVDRGRMA